VDNGYEILELPTPCVLTVASDESLAPRIAPLPGIIKAKKRKLPVWSASDIGADASLIGSAGAKATLDSLALPDFEGACEFIRGENPAQAAAMLVDRLRAEKII
jgi:electron transfer flavoprotein beta subunit